MQTGGAISSVSEDEPQTETVKDWGKFWTKEMEAAEKRFRKFTKRGNTINQRFLDARASGDNDGLDLPNRGGVDQRLNLFHTNVSTMMSMLYGQTPNIEVAREHQDPDDDIARVAATLFQRLLEADVRASGEDIATVYRACLQDRLLPGLGLGRVRYTFATTTVPTINPETMAVEDVEHIAWEDAPIDYLHWQDVRWGWCRNWKEMPWISFRSFLSQSEVKDRFGAKIANKLAYKNQLPTGSDNKDESFATDQKNNIQKAEIWEIWHKKERKVFWWSSGAPAVLDMKDDPLKLDGFWPCPKPMLANTTTTLMMPTADYVLAQDLYNQIDELYARIATITRAIKVVGVYDQSAGSSVGRMLKEGVENDLIPVDNWAMFAEKGGLKGSIDWFPVDMVVGTLQTLRSVLGETIELLYEVTGMSDVLRGANTDQYTSDGTNQLKAKFGSIRVQALQDEFARFCSDLEALKAEVVAKHFDQQSIAKQSGAQWLPQADHDKIEPALQLMKSPDVKWRVDIRPESIAMVDYAQLKAERTEYLTAMATFIQSGQAMVQAVPGSMPVLLEFMKFGMAGFKGSNYMEGILDQAIEMAKQAPPPGQEDQGPSDGEIKLQIEQIKQQGQQQKAQFELQKIQAKAQADLQAQQAKLQGEIQKIQVDLQADMTLEERQAKNRQVEIMMATQAQLREIQASLQADLTVEQAQAEYDIASQQIEHSNNIKEIRANAAVASDNQSRNGEE